MYSRKTMKSALETMMFMWGEPLEVKDAAAVLEAEGEAEYMKILQESYNTEEKAEFYNYIRSLDALKASLKGKDKTILLDKDSELAKVLYGDGLGE